MKKLLVTTILLTTLLLAKTVTINKGTAYEATLMVKNRVLYLNHNGKREKLFKGWEGTEDEPSFDVEFQIDDINFDGIDDIAIREMTGASGVNLYYKFFLAKNGNYEESNLSLSNYELYPTYNTILSEYKDGPRHFTDLYSVNNEHKIEHFVNYENYRGDDLCFVKELNIDTPKEPEENALLSCRSLLEEHEAVKLFAKVIKKKALLYNKSISEKSNGMYVIKGDIVELIDGEAESNKVLVQFRGKRVITKYINVKDLEVVPRKYYENRHTIAFYDSNKWTKEKATDILTLQKIGLKKYHFILSTIGKNAHMCDMEGTLDDKGKYLLYKKNACELKLHKTKRGIQTEDKNMKCKEFACGMHAFVGGLNFEEIKR